jgi:hypothetical protein
MGNTPTDLHGCYGDSFIFMFIKLRMFENRVLRRIFGP